MSLACGQKKSEVSQLINISVVPISEETNQKPMQVYAINKMCCPTKAHLEAFSNKLCLSGGTVDLLIGTDFAGGIVDIHVIPGKAGEPIAKRNCFGWYVMGQLSEGDDRSSAISSVDSIGRQDETSSRSQTHRVLQVQRRVKENNFNRNRGRESPSANAVDRWWAPEEEKLRYEGLSRDIQGEIQKPQEQEFFIEIPTEQVSQNVAEWHLPMQSRSLAEIEFRGYTSTRHCSCSNQCKTLVKALEAQYSDAAKGLCTHIHVDDIGGSKEDEATCKKMTS
ncbi:hypothetical protein P5673_030767 [Acropora cervicornis]|uniref:Uncharacterized protein n=1 Tax=Acropora cervicornis TaxID=6130 RepID=A0AAD9PTN9_ACRCE|nr:hypothetical protein P5673_030767 [Acropora cervicornis]